VGEVQRGLATTACCELRYQNASMACGFVTCVRGLLGAKGVRTGLTMRSHVVTLCDRGGRNASDRRPRQIHDAHDLKSWNDQGCFSRTALTRELLAGKRIGRS
jgi:hypothetical protein